jgi:thiol-disulfide isomerase/thioredoxin
MIHPALRVAGAALIAVVGVWAGVRVYSIHAAVARVPVQGGIAVPAGEASSPGPSDLDASLADSPLPPVKIPEHMPSFSLKSSLGKSTPISAWSGKSLVLNFWATWCAPCRREIPLLQALDGKWAAKDIAVVGIAVDHRDEVLAFANQFKITYPLLIGEQDALDVAAAFGVETPVFPFTVFTDRRGEVVALFLGELHRPQADLILNVVQNLNQDRLQLTESRRVIAEGLSELAAKSPS